MAKRKYFVLTAHDAEHREVVALRGIAYMLPDTLRQAFHHLPGSRKGLAGNDVEDTVIAKLQLLNILCLRQAVSIQEQSEPSLLADCDQHYSTRVCRFARRSLR